VLGQFERAVGGRLREDEYLSDPSQAELGVKRRST
jgi:hypothetical protein